MTLRSFNIQTRQNQRFWDNPLPVKTEKAFDPNQPRDERGRWTSGGSIPDGGLRQYIEQTAQFFGQGQPNVASYLLEHGQAYSFDEDSFIGGEPQQCYKNAALAVLEDPDLTYVEGFVSVHGVPIAHAWTVGKDGRVRDVTLASMYGISGNRERPAVLGYFGVPIQTDFLQRTLFHNRYYGILTGSDNPRHVRNLIQTDPTRVVAR